MQVVNAPGRFDRPPAKVAADVARWTSLEGVSAVTVSEVADPDRAKALEVDGWTLTHDGGPGKGECAILTQDATRTVIERGWLELLAPGGKARLAHGIVAPVVITKAPSGRLTLITMAHLPAKVEGIWRVIPLPSRTKAKILRKSKRPRIRAYLTAVEAWRQRVTHLAAKYHVDDVIVAADWNLNAHAKWVRQLIHGAWPGLTIAATKEPDLGRRCVGWLLTSMGHVGGHVYDAASSDHKAGRYVLEHVNAPPPVAKPPAPKAPNPFERVTYNGALMDQKTKAFVQCCEKDLKYALTILQGCYNAGGVSASAGTHDGGGVIDLAPFDHDRKVHVVRARGGFGWHRLPIPGVWVEHIHFGIRNHGKLAPAAARQQDDYDAHPPRDGLAGHSLDPTWHPDPPVAFSYLGAWHEIND